MNDAWIWRLAHDPLGVHDLLRLSDRHHARPGSPAPTRNPLTTARHVAAEHVYVLTYRGEIVGTFTCTDDPPAGLRIAHYAEAVQPAYLQRLAVKPEVTDAFPLIGIRCVRKACEIARQRGADVLRAEANPNLPAMRLLQLQGFVPCGRPYQTTGVRAVAMEKVLDY